jgi:A/G-specific adenine glycosylase
MPSLGGAKGGTVRLSGGGCGKSEGIRVSGAGGASGESESGINSSSTTSLVAVFSAETTNSLRTSLLSWYRIHRRALPWRGDAPPFAGRTITASEVAVPVSPYAVWVSEVMLQQTRVDVVIDFWIKWMAVFPTPAVLAMASSDEVNARWAGLGFYGRARALHKAAKVCVELHDGLVPSQYTQQLNLPGVGPYTAGAITSIAFKQPIAAVDGNVIRVIARLRALEMPAKSPLLSKTVWNLARQLVVPSSSSSSTANADVDAGDWTQSLMELGATICTPKNPNCTMCPIKIHCHAATLAAGAAIVDVEEIASSAWIAKRFPAPPIPKKPVPIENITAICIESLMKQKATDHSNSIRLLLVRSGDSTTASGSKAAAPRAGGGGSGSGAGAGGGGGGGGSSALSRVKPVSQLLKGQWQPICVPTVTTPRVTKRSRSTVEKVDDEDEEEGEGDDDIDDDAVKDLIPLPIDLISTSLGCDFVLHDGVATTTTKTKTTETLSSSRIATFDTITRGGARHVFSHIIIEANVERWNLRDKGGDDNITDEEEFITAVTKGSNCEARFFNIPNDIESIGATTFALRLLYSILKDDARRALTVVDGGSTTTTTTTTIIAWKNLIARWAKCGLKL